MENLKCEIIVPPVEKKTGVEVNIQGEGGVLEQALLIQSLGDTAKILKKKFPEAAKLVSAMGKPFIEKIV